LSGRDEISVLEFACVLRAFARMFFVVSYKKLALVFDRELVFLEKFLPTGFLRVCWIENFEPSNGGAYFPSFRFTTSLHQM
jgi:hypothetical protein